MATEQGPVVVRCDWPGCGRADAVSYAITRGGKMFDVDLCVDEHAGMVDAVIETAGREKVWKKGGTVDSYARYIRIPPTAFWHHPQAQTVEGG